MSKTFTLEYFKRKGRKGGKAGSTESKVKAARTRWDKVKSAPAKSPA